MTAGGSASPSTARRAVPRSSGCTAPPVPAGRSRSRPAPTPSPTTSGSSASTGPASARPRRTSTRASATGSATSSSSLDALAIDTCRLIGLSGGGPYVLAAGANLPQRVHGVGVLGGVAPTTGPDAAEGGIIQLAVHLAPLLRAARVPLGVALTAGDPAGQAARRHRPRPVRRRPAARGQEPAVAARSSRRCSSTTCCTAAGSRPRRRSATWCCSPGTGASTSPTSPCRCAGGTATRTTSSRSGTAGTSSTGCRTPRSRPSTARATWAASGIAEEVITTLMELGPRRAQPRARREAPRSAGSLVITRPMGHNGATTTGVSFRHSDISANEKPLGKAHVATLR